jgi:hypothetical protein
MKKPHFVLTGDNILCRRYKRCRACDGEWEQCPACQGTGLVDIDPEDRDDDRVTEVWVEQRGH